MRKGREVAPHRDLRNRKRFRKLRNLNGISRLEQPKDVLLAFVLGESLRVSPVADSAATLRPSRSQVKTSVLLSI